MSDNDGYLVEVIYPRTLAQESNEEFFFIRKPDLAVDTPRQSEAFVSQDESELTQNKMMQSDLHTFVRQHIAEEFFFHACE